MIKWRSRHRFILDGLRLCTKDIIGRLHTFKRRSIARDLIVRMIAADEGSPCGFNITVRRRRRHTKNRIGFSNRHRCHFFTTRRSTGQRRWTCRPCTMRYKPVGSSYHQISALIVCLTIGGRGRSRRRRRIGVRTCGRCRGMMSSACNDTRFRKIRDD